MSNVLPSTINRSTKRQKSGKSLLCHFGGVFRGVFIGVVFKVNYYLWFNC